VNKHFILAPARFLVLAAMSSRKRNRDQAQLGLLEGQPLLSVPRTVAADAASSQERKATSADTAAAASQSVRNEAKSVTPSASSRVQVLAAAQRQLVRFKLRVARIPGTFADFTRLMTQAQSAAAAGKIEGISALENICFPITVKAINTVSPVRGRCEECHSSIVAARVMTCPMNHSSLATARTTWVWDVLLEVTVFGVALTVRAPPETADRLILFVPDDFINEHAEHPVTEDDLTRHLVGVQFSAFLHARHYMDAGTKQPGVSWEVSDARDIVRPTLRSRSAAAAL